MYKKWHFCVLSVLCLFCMSFMLFSNTLIVKAATVTQSVSTNFTFAPDNTVTATSGAIYNGSGQILSSYMMAGNQYHFEVPINYFQSSSNWSFNDSGIALLNSYINYYGLFYFPSISVSNVEDYYVSNIVLCDKYHVPVTSHDGYFEQKTVKGSEVFDASLANVNMFYYLEFDLAIYETGVASKPKINITNGSISMDFRSATASEISAAAVEVTSNQLDSIADSSAAIETSVTSDTGGGLLATIKNFFGGFFSNLINSILGLFVPDSTYFSTWFNNLNTLLSDKLGMLYAPFDLLISTLNAIYSADTTEPGITFPGITWNGETVIEPYTFYFSSLGEDFQNLRDAVYFGTDVVLLFAFLHLLQKKIALVITGSEVNG